MLTITLLSLVVAAASGFVAWRSIRREHLRSHARVASLSAAIDDRAQPRRGAATGTGFDYPFEFQSEAALEFPSERAAAVAPVGTLTFDAMDGEPSVRRRLLGIVAGAAVVVAGVVSIAMMTDRYEPPAPRVISPHAESLELLSLDASRQGSTLAVSGLVRSRTEEPLTAVTAVVSAIDAKGRPVGRGSVALADIMPRRESRFVVTIADVNEAARYRVSFRSATGVIRHVDRRAARSSDVS
jgi:hypothetical protein